MFLETSNKQEAEIPRATCVATCRNVSCLRKRRKSRELDLLRTIKEGSLLAIILDVFSFLCA